MDELRTMLHESWSKALLAASSVEEQAQALAGRVGSLLDGAKNPEAARQLLAEISKKLEAQRRELQAHVQRAVQAALDRVKLPGRSEMEQLQQRLAQLEARLSSIEAGPGGRPGA